MYFINLKVEANCEQCHRVLDFNPSHDCFSIDYKFHERAHLLFYFNVFFATLDVLNLEPYLLDIQKTISANLLKLKYDRSEIANINSLANISSVIRSEESAFWCFDQLWRSHPDKAVEIVITPLPTRQPLADTDSAACLLTTEVISDQSDSAASSSTAEVISTALNQLHSDVSYSPDD